MGGKKGRQRLLCLSIVTNPDVENFLLVAGFRWVKAVVSLVLRFSCHRWFNKRAYLSCPGREYPWFLVVCYSFINDD